MIVLGIETSCDETGVALYDEQRGLIADVLHSQVELHAEYGGVVPELASRDHIRKCLPLIQSALQQANCSHNDLSGVAYTAGPGLVGALMVGTTLARSLAWGWNIPAIAINHMEGHLLAPMLEQRKPDYPFVALLVSGGHTQLVWVKAPGVYHVLGDTVDDAAGEAFDKTAKMLDLPYPGGPALSKLAQRGNPTRFHFPRPMTNKPGLQFSFSGLKTFAINTYRKSGNDNQTRADIARAFEDAVVETLVIKCKRALQQTGLQRLVIAGGVSANQNLRDRLNKLSAQTNIQVYFPHAKYCTDNGAMIAYAGYLRLKAGQSSSLSCSAYPRWSIENLDPIS